MIRSILTLTTIGILVPLSFLSCERKSLVAGEGQSGVKKDSGTKEDPGKSLARKSDKELRIVFSSWMDGHLEPCGCSSAQAGGLDRRAFWLGANKARYDAKLEGGNLLEGKSPLEKHKLLTILTILGDSLSYPVLPLGPRDLELGLADYLDFDGAFGPRFLATDLRWKDKKNKVAAPFATYSIVKAGSYRICVLSLVGKTPKGEKLFVEPAEKAVRAALKAAGTRGKDYHLVVLFNNSGGATRARQHAKKLAGIDLVACVDQAHDEASPHYESFRHEKSGALRQVLYVGGRGKSLLLWHGVPSKEGPWITTKTQKIRLDRPGTDQVVTEMMLAFKRSLPEEKILEKMAEKEPTENGAKYVGNKVCADCHEDAMEAYQKSKHSHSWQTLIDRGKRDQWPVTSHPECVHCHSVGYGEKSGFVTYEKTPHLAAVGCENCHGAGSDHVAYRENEGEYDDEAQEAAAAKKGTLGKAGLRHCLTCHDLEQSPRFLPQEKWKKIKH